MPTTSQPAWELDDDYHRIDQLKFDVPGCELEPHRRPA